MERISLLKLEMLFPNDAMISGIKVVSFPSSRVIVDQLPTWDLDTTTLNRQISEHSLPFINSDCQMLTVFLSSGVRDTIKQVQSFSYSHSLLSLAALIIYV